MYSFWGRLLPMFPVFLEGVLYLICGIYQLMSGKESFLMSSYIKKYNYAKKRKQFVKMCGILHISCGIFIAILLPILYLRASAGEMLLASVPVLCVLGIGQRIMLHRYTDNLEERKYRQ